jgi:hypothetical protein
VARTSRYENSQTPPCSFRGSWRARKLGGSEGHHSFRLLTPAPPFSQPSQRGCAAGSAVGARVLTFSVLILPPNVRRHLVSELARDPSEFLLGFNFYVQALNLGGCWLLGFVANYSFKDSSAASDKRSSSPSALVAARE